MSSAIISQLKANLTKLPAKDQAFATELCKSVTIRGYASEKQSFWLGKLLETAIHGTPQRPQFDIGDLSGLNRLFAKAQSHLKRPAIVIQLAGHSVKLNIAGSNARVPGSINVVETNGGEWFGRILATGKFEASPRCSLPNGLVAGLTRFASDPATVASEHGKLTGNCCFCNRGLTDERSTSVGYDDQHSEALGFIV